MPTASSNSMTALFSSISNLCKVLGVVLAAHGLGGSGVAEWIQLVGGSVMVVGPAVWDIWEKLASLRTARAVGVQAGINLTVSGHALSTDGTVVSSNGGGTPPLPVTEATAGQIVANFGPSPGSIAKA